MRGALALLRSTLAVLMLLAVTLPHSAAMAQAKPPIKFGVVAAVSGEAASYSKPFLDAIQMIAEDFNKEGGIMGRPVQVVFYDDRGIPDAALQAAKKLVFDDKVHTLQPGSTSGAIFTAMPVARTAKWPCGAMGSRSSGSSRARG
jgi:branched-chain amino acid transport system substrate-binding protein